MFGRRGKKDKAAPLPLTEESKVQVINTTFNKYADSEEPDSLIVEDSVGQICDDLGIDGGSDVRAIVLLWKLGATRKTPDKAMIISRDMFKDRMLSLGASDIESIKAILPSLDPGFLESDAFSEFYAFSFDLNREVPRKTLLKETAIDLLPVVITADRAPHMQMFLSFLAEHSSLKDVTLDQWKTFIKFNQQVSFDCSGYSADDGAWPLLFDEYVEWRTSKL